MNIPNFFAKMIRPTTRKVAANERLKAEVKTQLDRVYRMGYQVGYLDGRARRPSRLELENARRNKKGGPA